MRYIIFLMVIFLMPFAVLAEKLELKDVTLDYKVMGNGPPLFMLHGGMESRNSFANQALVLKEHFTLIGLDSREQGRSSSSPTKISYEVMMRDVMALARHLGFETFSILGQSDGGITALTLAINYPHKVDNLILMGTNYNFMANPEEARNFMSSYVWDGNKDPNSFPGMYIEDHLKGQPDLSNFGALIQEMAHMWATSPTFSTDDLAKVRARTLIINGDHEDVDLNHVKKMHGAIKGSELFIVPDATHFLHIEKPDPLNKALLKFLNN